MTTRAQPGWDEPCYVISVVSRMVGVTAQTLRYFERIELVAPSRSGGNIRLYSPRDIERLRRIKTLVYDMGVNAAGVDVILRLTDRIQRLEGQVEFLRDELDRLTAGAEGEEPQMVEGTVREQ
ncbi:MAG: MerR family transcriptional regulator [Chloroflexota bacterium]|nr:MerR family transcriptional regulator [Chloroflexota bacterium]MDE2969556.1 MerR family transcriptional regulator [Chloroflexota bacterium]